MRILKIMLAVILFLFAFGLLIVGNTSFFNYGRPVLGVVFLILGGLCALGGIKLIKN